MRLYAYETNEAFRNIRKKQFNLHSQQKLAFKELLRHQPIPHFKDPDFYPTLAQGIPSEFRHLVWPALVPNPHALTPLFYSTLCQHLQQHQQLFLEGHSQSLERERVSVDRTSISTIGSDEIKHTATNPNANEEKPNRILLALERIEKDLPRTFPELRNLHEDGQEYKRLQRILGCAAIVREDLGYIQGMSQIAALLLLELNDEFLAFATMMNILHTNPLNDIFSFNESVIQVMSNRVSQKVKKLSSETWDLLVANEVEFNILVLNWVMTMFTRCFQLDCILNIWDILLANQLSFSILQDLCAAVAVARKGGLLNCKSPSQVARLLLHTKLDLIEEEWVLEYLRALPRT